MWKRDGKFWWVYKEQYFWNKLTKYAFFGEEYIGSFPSILSAKEGIEFYAAEQDRKNKNKKE